MKKIYNSACVSLAIFSILGLWACNDFLTEEPRGQLATVNFFKSSSDLKSSVSALYSVVGYGNSQNNFMGTNFTAGDDISTHPASNKASLREYDQYNVNSNNAWMPSMWSTFYKCVKAANFIMNGAPDTPGATEDEINFAIGNAAYWRAFSYFNLVTTWGAVPLILDNTVDREIVPTPVEGIYEQILEDLELAESVLPINYSESPYTMNGINIAVGQAAAKATLAYVYMCMAGWPMNKTEYYDKAAAKAKEVIDNVKNGTYNYSLLDDYSKVHSIEYNYKNPEVLLGIYYNRNGNLNLSVLADFLQDMIQGGWGDTNGEIKFWKDFPDGPRKEATYFPKVMLTDGVLHDWWYEAAPGAREVVAPVFMKSVEGAQEGEEFDYANKAALPYNGNKTHQIIRLSEVYCWYAEALGRSGKIDALAVEVLNEVRNRADGQVTNLYSTSMAPVELAEAAYDEHGWEIAGYYWCSFASRARDMFRMYRMKEHFEYRKQNPEIEVAPGVFRKEAVPVTGEWDDSKMYAPYPYEDTVINPNLKK